MNKFCKCPRCGSSALEVLQSYSHCIDCFYFVDHFYDTETAYHQAREAESLLEQKDHAEQREDHEESGLAS